MWSEADHMAQRWLASADAMPFLIQRWPPYWRDRHTEGNADILDLATVWDIKVGDIIDDLFTVCLLPRGWSKLSMPCPYWTRILDSKERVRGMIFYRSYGPHRKATLVLCKRYSAGWEKENDETPDADARFRAFVSDGGKIVEHGAWIGPFGTRYWNGISHEVSVLEEKLNVAFPNRKGVFSHWGPEGIVQRENQTIVERLGR